MSEKTVSFLSSNPSVEWIADRHIYNVQSTWDGPCFIKVVTGPIFFSSNVLYSFSSPSEKFVFKKKNKKIVNCIFLAF